MGSQTTGTSKTTDSALSLAQTQILKERESLFQNWYMPEVKSLLEEFNPNSEAGKAQMSLNANQINQSFNAAQKQTTQSLAQQNLLGSGAGAALTQANNRARASALANAYTNQMATSTSNKANTLANLSTLMPSTTNAAPMLSSSTTSQPVFSL